MQMNITRFIRAALIHLQKQWRLVTLTSLKITSEKIMIKKLVSNPLCSNCMILAGAAFNVAALFLPNGGTYVALGCAFIAIGAGLKTA